MDDLKRMLKYVRPYWLMFVLAFAAMILGAAFETALGALLVPVFDQFMQSTGTGSTTLFALDRLIPANDWFRAWITISSLLLAFLALKGIAAYVSGYLMAKIGQAAILNLRRELYDHLLQQSAVFFERHRSNHLVSRLVVSCGAIEQAFSTNLRDVIRETVILVFLMGATFYLNWRLAFGSLLLGPIIGLLTTTFSRRMRGLADVSLEGNRDLYDTAQETLSNIVVVKAYGAEGRRLTRFLDNARTIAAANLRTAAIGAISPPVLELIGGFAIVVFLYVGLLEISSGRVEPAQFFAFLYFLFRSYDPMRKISRQHNEITKGLAAAKDVWDILDENETLPERPDAVKLELLRDSISIRNVSFHYRSNDRLILSNIDLEIPKGQTVALVGKSGGGKSSLTKLIQRLYDPTSGAVLWDGVDLRDASVLSLRKQIALVTQETVLFNDTVRNNIAFGRPDATDAEIADAARVSFADDFIDTLPEGYDTLIGERGQFLSGGQRQRIAIARAVLINAPVLILDEATSALDTESERLVQLGLENLMRNRTSIVIAHRLSTIQKADKIVVMEAGRIVEAGTHDELLKVNGTYTRLYNMQFADADIDIEH